MDSDCNTDSLRSMATHWTLAGDDNLLNILQNTHKKIVSKCEEVNAKLDEMVLALDDTSINLQNVNNKFMALSNSQFIESRVYDDDEATEEATPAKEMAAQPQPSQSEMMKKSLSILESMHEVVTILRDSDTESDTDDEDIARLVLKPKDMYRDRPLPYIIGTEPWKNKWHAGLIVEDSDTDSCTSKPEDHTPEYSESEDEEPVPSQKSDVAVYEKEQAFVREDTHPEPEMTQSDMAAELARRLAAQAPPFPEPEEEYSPPRPAVKTVYRPQQPTTGIIFSDEPPPLEEQDSDSGQDDIFAELHTSQAHSKNEGLGRSVADDLFGVTSGRTNEDIFGSTSNKVLQDDAVPHSSSYTNERNAPPEDRRYINEEVIDKGSKKPVGGISVFGPSKGADSIGAAILKRKIRKKSTSDDESNSGEQRSPPQRKNNDQADSVNKEKDILNDLFAKPKIDGKKSKTSTEQRSTERLQEVKISEENHEEKVDLFSDNIFDDIDDIFSSSVVTIPKSDNKTNKQSIFNDDLFADVPPSKVANNIVSSDKRGLFDSDDDDLFGDKPPKVETSKNESQNNIPVSSVNLIASKESENKMKISQPRNDITVNKNLNESVKAATKIIKEPKSIFDSDSDSDIFSGISNSKLKMGESPKTAEPVKLNLNTSTSNINSRINIAVDDNTPKVDSIERATESENVLKIDVDIKKYKSPSLFDEDEDNLFNTGPDKNITDDIKNIRETKETSDKFNNDTITSNEKQSYSKKSTQDTPEVVIQSSRNICDKLSEDTLKENIEDAVLNTNNTTTVTLDTENTGKAYISSEVEPKNINSINTDEKEVLFSDECNPILSKDIISNILSEPPAFEKPKEPKKSKNVNALFDDDSDDESLFFKRSDVIDEAPESFSANVNQDASIGIFHDEPPAIDIEFPATIDVPDDASHNFDSDLNSLHTVLDMDKSSINKPVLSNIKIPETPSPAWTKSDDFTEYKDIFSSIDSENIFTPTKEYDIPINKHSIDKGNNFDDLFNTSKENLHSPKTKSDTKKPDLLSTTRNNIRLVDEDLFGVTNDKLIDNLQDKIGEDTKKSEEPGPNDLFRSLKIPPRTNQEKSPVIPYFDDSDEELFKPSTSIVKPESILTSSQPDSKLFGPAGDSEIKISKKEENKLDFSKTKKDNSLSNTEVKLNTNQEYYFTDSNSEYTNTATSKTVNENRLETEENVDIKKIGKLKNVILNIDVATLLPGASLNKQNKLQTETIKTTKSSTEQIKVENKINDKKKTEPAMIKSINFEGEPNSDVLDNKLSKERAKIQVKRRPSTRKARREAVRKSAIDLDDSTDNSSSIDDLPKKKTDLNDKRISSEVLEKGDQVKNIEELQTSEKSTDLVEQQEPKVTKIVYILNDDDIFDNRPKTSDQDINDRTKNTDNTVESKKESGDFTDGIKTIGKVYENIPTDKPETTKEKKNVENERKATKSSLFDEPNDDELFNKNKKSIPKASIFDSDNEEDLFTGKKKKVEKKTEVKSSLFGDDDDEDDQLFTVKNKHIDTKADVLRPHISRETIKSSEPVFDDPLSLLDDEE